MRKNIIILALVLCICAVTLAEFRFAKTAADLSEDLKNLITKEGLDKVVTYFTDDAEVCLNDKCGSARETWAPFIGTLKTFDYKWKFGVHTHNEVVLDCVDYAETEDGCRVMFPCQTMVRFNDDGKVDKFHSMCDHDGMIKLTACITGNHQEL